MSESKKKKRKKKTFRTKKERLEEAKRKTAQLEAELAMETVLTAVKDERVAEENLADYKKLLRQYKAIEKAPGVLVAFGKDDAATIVEKLRKKLITKLENLLEEESEGDDEEEEAEGESESEEEDEDGDEEEDEEDDDEDEDDDEEEEDDDD